MLLDADFYWTEEQEVEEDAPGGLPIGAYHRDSFYDEGRREMLFWDVAEAVAAGRPPKLAASFARRYHVPVSVIREDLAYLVQQGRLSQEAANQANGLPAQSTDPAEWLAALSPYEMSRVLLRHLGAVRLRAIARELEAAAAWRGFRGSY